MSKIPTIVCLCGSTRFYQEYRQANRQETLAGKIILAPGVFVHSGDPDISENDKIGLDELHLRKIDLAHEVLILNVGGYVGESTRREYEYAKAQGKLIRWWEPDKAL